MKKLRIIQKHVFVILTATILFIPLAYSLPATVGPYIGISAGYAPTISNKTQTYQMLSGVTVTNRDKNQAATSYALSAGYRFRLNTHLLWSVGGEYFATNFKTKGSDFDQTGSKISNYSYTTSSQSIFLDNRLYFNPATEVNYPHTYSGFVGVLVGTVDNKSKNYDQSTQPQLLFHAHKSHDTAGGIEVGGDYNLSRHGAIGINVRYLLLGKQGFAAYTDPYSNYYSLNTETARYFVSAQYSYTF